MKLKLLFTTLLFSLISFAQIPTGYYSSATGTGYTLKTQLYNIIKGHTDNGYDGLYTIYQTSDRDYYFENDGTVLDMYSENPKGIDPYNYSSGSTERCGNYSVEGDCYNREHIIPQSVFNKNAPMVSDAHSVTPTDGKVNGIRSNYPHGNVASVSITTLNGSKLGSSGVAGYSGTVFEPIDEFKGDIARMYLYFATRYENNVAGYNFAMFNNTSDQVFTTAFLNMLLTWHAQDRVDDRERARNRQGLCAGFCACAKVELREGLKELPLAKPLSVGEEVEDLLSNVPLLGNVAENENVNRRNKHQNYQRIFR